MDSGCGSGFTSGCGFRSGCSCRCECAGDVGCGGGDVSDEHVNIDVIMDAESGSFRESGRAEARQQSCSVFKVYSSVNYCY